MSRFVHEVHMRWSDMDAYRHINNSAYLAYLEQARVAMFFHRHDGFATGTLIRRHEIDYLQPVVYHPEPLRVELWVENVRGARFTVRYEVFDQDRLAARASTMCVTFDFAINRPRRLTEEELGILHGFADGPAAGPTADGPTAGGRTVAGPTPSGPGTSDPAAEVPAANVPAATGPGATTRADG